MPVIQGLLAAVVAVIVGVPLILALLGAILIVGGAIVFCIYIAWVLILAIFGIL